MLGASVALTLPVLILLLTAPARSQGGAAALDPLELLARIDQRGPAAVMAEVYESDARWNAVIEGIASGVRPWLAVAERLKPAAGNASEELTVAVARALEKQPANALSILGQVFDIDDVCSLNTLEESLGSDYPSALRAVDRRQKAVTRVSDPRLGAQRTECLAFLAELRREVVRNRATWFPAAGSR